MKTEKIFELRDEINKQGVSVQLIDQLIDEVGKFATETAVEATTRAVIEQIKKAAEEGKEVYEEKLKENPDTE